MSIYGSIFRSVLFPVWETWLHGRHTPKYLKELDRTQWLSSEEVRKRQQEGIHRIVNYAYEEVPLYRRRFDEAGIDPDKCLEPEVWNRIPLLNKSDLQQHQEALLAESYRDKPVIVSHSGGSTGNPVEFKYNRDHYDRRIAAWFRAERWAGWELGEHHVVFMLGVGSGVGERPKLEEWKEHTHWRFLRWMMLTVTKMSRDRMRLYHKKIVKFRPRTIFGYTYPLFAFAKFLEEEGLELPPLRGIIISGEKSFAYQKETMRQVFKAPVFERYGSQEFCSIAAECEEHGGMHINADGLYVEVLRDDGTQAESGEVGHLVVTGFDNMAMPFIRYKVGDMGSLSDEPCPCGRGLPLLKSMVGREMDMISSPEGNICAGIMFPHFMKEFAHIKGFQFIQETLDHLRLRIVPDKDFDKSILSFMEEQLRRYVGSTMRIDFEFVDELETLMSGKYKMVVSKVKV